MMHTPIVLPFAWTRPMSSQKKSPQGGPQSIFTFMHTRRSATNVHDRHSARDGRDRHRIWALRLVARDRSPRDDADGRAKYGVTQPMAVCRQPRDRDIR